MFRKLDAHLLLHNKTIGAQCVEDSIRLTNGPSQYEGRLEICLGGGWGTVCDDGFSKNDAIVACRQLGFLMEGKSCSLVSY